MAETKYIPPLEKTSESQELMYEISLRHEYSVGIIGELVQSLNNNLEKLFESIPKEYFDKGLGEVIKSSINEIVGSENNKKYYDTELGNVIKSALMEAVSKISNIRLDTSPITKLASEISSQNKSILDAVMRIPAPSNNDDKYQELINTILGMVAQNQEFLKNTLNVPETKRCSYKSTIIRNKNTGEIETIISDPL